MARKSFTLENLLKGGVYLALPEKAWSVGFEELVEAPEVEAGESFEVVSTYDLACKSINQPITSVDFQKISYDSLSFLFSHIKTNSVVWSLQCFLKNLLSSCLYEIWWNLLNTLQACYLKIKARPLQYLN